MDKNITPKPKENNFLLCGTSGCLFFLVVIAIVGIGTYFFYKDAIDDWFKDEPEAVKEAVYYTSEPDEDKLMETEEWGEVPVNEVLVVLSELEDKLKAEELAEEVNGEIVGELSFMNLYQIRTDANTEEELAMYIETAIGKNYVESAVPNYPLYLKEEYGIPCSIYEDVYDTAENSISYEMIGLEKAWQYIAGSGVNLNKVHVGVVDDGLNEDAIDKAGDVSFKATKAEDATSDYGSHGTAVANVLAGSWDNSGTRGVAGGLGDKLEVTFSNTITVPTDEMTLIGKIDPEDPTQTIYNNKSYSVLTYVGIYKQIEAGATVINYSLGPTKPGVENKDLSEMHMLFLQKMAKDNPKVIFVAAAGNENGKLDGKNYGIGGLKLPNVITVGALDHEGNKASFSNTAVSGGEITLSTSGVDIPVGFAKDGSLNKWNGTSFSAPQVTGAIALIQSINKDLTAKEIKDLLVKTASATTTDPLTEIEKPVPPGMGKLLRIDQAVLEALKTLPEDQRPESLDEKYLLGLSEIFTAAIPQDDPLTYNIEARLDTIGSKGTDVAIEVQGEGFLGGVSQQTITEPGVINWTFTFPEKDKEATILITRLDTNACERITLSSTSDELTFKGTFSWEKKGSIGANSKSDFYLRIYTFDGETIAKFTFGEYLFDGWPVYLVTHTGNHYVFESSTRSFVERVRIVFNVTDTGMSGTVDNITPDISTFVRGSFTGKPISFEQYSAEVLD